ncbi:hypothetical protein IJH01_00555 [Candidatus Saccharibacteria bacterium]|nr:hypothetical protein [Candidatus Saccharibacteria bacterium]
MQNTALKRTMIVIFAIVFIELAIFVKLAYGGDDAYVDTRSEPPMLEVREAVYVPPIEVLPISEEVITDDGVEDGEEIWPEENVFVGDGGVWYYEDYSESGEQVLVPYDGSGYYNANLNDAWHSGGDFMFSGGYDYDDGSGFSYTWYSENVLPGGELDIPGRHVDDEGYVVDGDSNICIASDDLPKGTVVDVPFGGGTAVVYDSGSGYGNLDVYVSW